MNIISLTNGEDQTFEITSSNGITTSGKMKENGYSSINPNGDAPFSVKLHVGAPWGQNVALENVSNDAWILFTGGADTSIKFKKGATTLVPNA